MKLAINQILGVSICSYRWPLDLYDSIREYLKDDLYEISKNGKVKVSNKYVDIKEIDCNFTYCDDMVENQCKDLSASLDMTCLDKYGVTVKGYNIRKPQYYNYEQDSLDMEIECTGWNRMEQYPDLIPYVQDYIDNVRQKSRDGYCSFEPDKVEKVEKSDYAYIRAVLKKEDMLDNNKYRLEEWINDIVQNELEYVDKIRYEYNGKNYKLDYDNKRLLLLKDKENVYD